MGDRNNAQEDAGIWQEGVTYRPRPPTLGPDRTFRP